MLEIKNAMVKYESRGKTAHGRSWGALTTISIVRFARDVAAKSHATTIHAIPPVRQKQVCTDNAIEIVRVKITEAGRQVRCHCSGWEWWGLSRPLLNRCSAKDLRENSRAGPL